MKRLSKSEQKNKGFSLIEVLVAMAIICLISVPLIRTFVISANVNKKARKIQNATDIAQNVSEYFTTLSLDELKDKYLDDSTIRTGVLYDDATSTSSGAIVFQNVGDGLVDDAGVPYYEGADGEDFYVTVVLNPRNYSGGTVSDVGNINNYYSPEIGDIFSSDIVTVFTQFTKYDHKAKAALDREYKGVTGYPTSYGYANIKKTTNIYIEQKQNASNSNKIDVKYHMTVRYTYCNIVDNNYVETDFYVEYNFVLYEETVDSMQKEVKDLYLLYTPFDVNDSNNLAGFARDEMNIYYCRGELRQSWERDVDIYLIQQQAGTQSKGLHENNVNLYAYSEPIIETPPSIDDAKTKHKNVSNLTIYANIIGWEPEYKITAGSSAMVKLYSVDVYVWYREKDTTDMLNYTSSNYKPESYFTLVSTIKEE